MGICMAGWYIIIENHGFEQLLMALNYLKYCWAKVEQEDRAGTKPCMKVRGTNSQKHLKKCLHH